MMLLQTKALSRRYGGLTAVDRVDFSLPEGQVHALIGPNGAGKSTFVGMVAGRIKASDGEVWFDGKDVTPLPAHARIRRGMAYTFQITAIYARLSLFDNVALALGSREEADVLAVLDRVGLRDRADQIAGTLSYEIAGFKELIGRLRAETTILLIEHNMDVVMSLADAITVLETGRVLASGTPEEVRADARVQHAYLGTAPC